VPLRIASRACRPPAPHSVTAGTSRLRGRLGRGRQPRRLRPGLSAAPRWQARPAARISLLGWRDASAGCPRETSTVAGSVRVTQLRTRYG
jgi:hypothetical protein